MVVTETLKVEAVVALTVMVAGTEQFAPSGAPVQVSVAVPPRPTPPIDNLYVALWPAGTVAVLEPSEGTTSPRPAPLPDSDTDCGLPEALSAIWTLPVRLPWAVGVKVTEIVQLTDTATDELQVLVWAKSSETVMPEMASDWFPLLTNVIACAALVLPIASEVKLRLPGET